MLSLISLVLATHAVNGPVQLKVSPQPQSIKLSTGSFTFKNSTLYSVDKMSEDGFAADQLVEEVKKDLKLPLRQSQSATVSPIVITRKRGAHEDKIGQGYHLEIRPDHIELSAQTSDGVFYGIQTLKQLIRANRQGRSIPACTIDDWPELRYRGWQHDISRGPIPTLAYLKKEVRTLSEFKLNMFTLYTEHVFKLKKHPEIAPNDGITASEVQKLSEYAKKYHVEVVGNFQSFGHFANILKVPAYASLGENPWVLSPAKEESYKFLSDVYSEIAPAYESKLFNINCDEVSGLGDGPSKDLVKKIGVAGVYANHINRIADLLHARGKTPMMWGDIALNYPAIVPRLPKDLIVLPWAYDARASFEDQILPFTKYGLRFMVCPGVSCWSQIWPDTHNAIINISNFIRDGARLGAMGVLNTAWDDDGQNLSNDDWYEFCWGAECSWKPVKVSRTVGLDAARNSRVSQFDDCFPQTFYGLQDSSLSSAINRMSALRSNPISGGLGNGAIWRDPVDTFAKLNNITALQDFSRSARSLQSEFEKARSTSTYNSESLDYASFAAKEIRFLSDVLLAVNSLKSGNEDGIKSVNSDLQKLKSEYKQLWMGENRNWWLDINLKRFDDLSKKLDTLSQRVLIESSVPGNSQSPIVIRSLSSLAKIHFTTDGRAPSESSLVYSSPIKLTKTSVVKAIGFWPDGKVSQVQSETFYLPLIPCQVTTNLAVYADNFPVKAFDGSEKSFFWSEGALPKGGYLTVDFDEPKMLSSIRVLTGHPDHTGDFLHRGDLEVSSDGQVFKKVAEFTNGEAHADSAAQLIRAIRVIATQDQNSWLIIREIEIK